MPSKEVEMAPMEFQVVGWPKPPPPDSKNLDRFYGGFKFQDLSGGNVRIIGDWERDNIVTVKVKVRGPMKQKSVQLHHRIAPMFVDLMEYLYEAFPGYFILQLGGFCPRHKMHDPKFGLSVHSWGAAVDINWDTNLVSKSLITSFPPGFPEVFEGAGWNWGGRWRQTKDSMHFQFTRGG